jgi:hypothetical protein
MAGELAGLRRTLRESVRKAWDEVDSDYSIRVSLSDLVKNLVAESYRNCLRTKQTKPAADCLAEVARTKELSKKLREYWKPTTE